MTPLTRIRLSETRRGSRRRPLPVVERVAAAPSNPERVRAGERVVTADGTTVIRSRKRR